jgi:hypothetical protein
VNLENVIHKQVNVNTNHYPISLIANHLINNPALNINVTKGNARKNRKPGVSLRTNVTKPARLAQMIRAMFAPTKTKKKYRIGCLWTNPVIIVWEKKEVAIRENAVNFAPPVFARRIQLYVPMFMIGNKYVFPPIC